MSKAKFVTGIMNDIIVYKGGARVGHGYIIMANGHLMEPVLFDDKGNELPPTWYNLKVGDKQMLVVLPTGEQ